MGKCTVTMPDGFLLKLSQLGSRTDEIVPNVLAAGAEVVESKVRANLKSAIGKSKERSRSTGELLSSLGVSPAKQNRDGDFDVKIGFSEPRSDGGSNAKIATILEYGKSGQPARPFMKPAKTASKSACIEAMRQKFDEEVQKL